MKMAKNNNNNNNNIKVENMYTCRTSELPKKCSVLF
jgi:hypothetical protein